MNEAAENTGVEVVENLVEFVREDTETRDK